MLYLLLKLLWLLLTTMAAAAPLGKGVKFYLHIKPLLSSPDWNPVAACKNHGALIKHIGKKRILVCWKSGCWLPAALAGGCWSLPVEGNSIPEPGTSRISLSTHFGTKNYSPSTLWAASPPRDQLYLHLWWDFLSSKHCNILNLFLEANAFT